MRFRITPKINDGKAEAPPYEMKIDDLVPTIGFGKMIARIEDDFVNDEGRFFGVGFSILIERIEDETKDHSHPHYGMYSTEGDRAVHGQLAVLMNEMRAGTHYSPADMEHQVDNIVNSVARQGYPEVGDTAVREAMWEALSKTMKPLGYNMIDYGWYGE